MTNDLAGRRCTPCRKDSPKLTDEEIRPLIEALPDWKLEDGSTRIERGFTFKNFAEAFEFVGQVAKLAEAEDHHPDIAFGWGYARISFQTHSIGGLHENDFILAGRCDRAFAG